MQEELSSNFQLITQHDFALPKVGSTERPNFELPLKKWKTFYDQHTLGDFRRRHPDYDKNLYYELTDLQAKVEISRFYAARCHGTFLEEWKTWFESDLFSDFIKDEDSEDPEKNIIKLINLLVHAMSEKDNPAFIAFHDQLKKRGINPCYYFVPEKGSYHKNGMGLIFLLALYGLGQAMKEVLTSWDDCCIMSGDDKFIQANLAYRVSHINLSYEKNECLKLIEIAAKKIDPRWIPPVISKFEVTFVGLDE